MKLTVSAIVVLLFIGAASSSALEAREPVSLVARTKGLPPPPNLVARTKGLPPPPNLVARQDETTPSPTEPTTPTTPTPAIPPDNPLATILQTDVPSASASAKASAPVSAYTPTGTGTLIPAWSSLVAAASGTLPATQPTAAPTSLPTDTIATTPTPNAAHKVESGLIGGAVIAGFVGLFL